MQNYLIIYTKTISIDYPCWEDSIDAVSMIRLHISTVPRSVCIAANRRYALRVNRCID